MPFPRSKKHQSPREPSTEQSVKQSKNQRLYEFANSLNLSDDFNPIKSLAILTVASCDPSAAIDPNSPHYHNDQTVLDSIAFAAFFNRLSVVVNCNTQQQSSFFTKLYLDYLCRLISHCLSISLHDASELLNDRLNIFERVFLSAPQGHRSEKLLNIYTDLLCADYYSKTLRCFCEKNPVPLVDAFERSRMQISAASFFQAFSTFFNSTISQCCTYIQYL